MERGHQRLKVKMLLLCCALHKFHVIDVKKKCTIRLQVIKGPNTPDQIDLCVNHSFLVEVQTNAG